MTSIPCGGPKMTSCPLCGAELKDVIGSYGDDETYDGVVCPNGCDLWSLYT